MIYYTTTEQSKKLIELGLNPDTADMYLKRSPILNHKERWLPHIIKTNKLAILFDDDIIPCWSVGALLEVMPKTMKGIPEKATYSLTLKENAYNAWKCNYEHLSFGELYAFPTQPTPLEAAYNTVVWLLENDYIKKGE